MKVFRCSHCLHTVFFENTSCGHCGLALGYDLRGARMLAFEVEGEHWQLKASQAEPQEVWRPCANYTAHGVCNWMLCDGDPRDKGQTLCASCRHTTIIPALSEPANHGRWYKLETAKRRLIRELYALKLPLPTRAEDPKNGLAFEFKAPLDGAPVMTGHAQGIITLNIVEADDPQREANRNHLGEPYRTLLGHMRHESGHYYWDRLIAGNERWLARFRALFGDERQNYAEALKKHYEQGARQDWPQDCISAYASCHPWEDWAECWAHYLHIVDALDTASFWQMRLVAPSSGETLEHPVRVTPAMSSSFRTQLYKQWLPLSQCLNSMGRSLGEPDFYPFVMPNPVLDKLAFIHARLRSMAMQPGSLKQGLAPKDVPAATDIPETSSSSTSLEPSP